MRRFVLIAIFVFFAVVFDARAGGRVVDPSLRAMGAVYGAPTEAIRLVEERIVYWRPRA